MDSKPFHLMDDAAFQRLSKSEKIVYLAKAMDAIRGEAPNAKAADPQLDPQTEWEKTIPVGTPLPTRKPR